jgi:hypothetical protein
MVKKRAGFLAAVMLLAVGTTNASAFCFEEAGAQYGINPQILRAIAKVESNFNPAAINKNSNGSYDFGLMQINTIWAPTIGKERWSKLGDACENTKTGAWILSMCMEKYGYTWKAIGCYNSQTPHLRDKYSQKVFAQLQKVKPVEQEAAYSPLKDNVEALVRAKVDNWVDEAAQGKRTEFKEKAKAKVPTVAKAVQEHPSMKEDPPMQVSLPGISQTLSSVSSAPTEAVASYDPSSNVNRDPENLP